jgi:hypothetical protein
VHLRPPSIAHGVISLIWGVGLGIFVWIGLRAVGIENATAFVIGCVGGFLIFLFVRVYGEEEPRRP